MSEEFRGELRDLVDRHAARLDPDDLRSVADDLDAIADRWEVSDDVL